jgi:hypothetical protein
MRALFPTQCSYTSCAAQSTLYSPVTATTGSQHSGGSGGGSDSSNSSRTTTTTAVLSVLGAAAVAACLLLAGRALRKRSAARAAALRSTVEFVARRSYDPQSLVQPRYRQLNAEFGNSLLQDNWGGGETQFV